MNRKAFFDAVRTDPFNGSLGAKQVSGMDAILDEWDRRGLTDLRWLAYMLATAFHETACSMQPIKEYGGRAYFMRMYDRSGDRPHVARALGNTMVGDGAEFCGRGFVQLTGRRNYALASKKLGADFIVAPDLVMVPRHAAAIMYEGMIEGWFTSRKLADYFFADRADWTNARRIINGTDKAAIVAGYARAFHAALTAAQEFSTEAISARTKPPPQVSPLPVAGEKPPDLDRLMPIFPKPPQGGFFHALAALLKRILRRE